MPYTLKYFSIRGLAEPIRLLLEDAGQKYEDVRFSSEAWWTGGKKAEFANVGLCPFGQVPVLEDPSFCSLTQSSAIMRYLAKALGYYGSDAKAQYICDAVDDGVNKDWRSSYVAISYPDDESKYPQLKKDYIEKDLVKYLKINETILKHNDGGQHYIAGKEITFADFALWEMLDISNTLVPGCLAKDYPALDAYYRRIAERPNIKAYLASGRRPNQVNNSKFGV